MEKVLIEIYRILKDGRYHTSIEMAKYLNVSDRTCRKYVKELAMLLKEKKIDLISKPRYGYILLGNILKENEIFNTNHTKIPITPEDRFFYLINLLLSSEEYTKIEDISNEIYTSSKTISQDLKKVEKFLEKYNIVIERKPHYGFKAYGNELDIRNLMVDMFETRLNENKYIKDSEIKNIEYIAKYLNKYFKENKIKVSDISLQTFIVSLHITEERIKLNRYIEFIDIEKDRILENKLEKIKDVVNGLETNLKFSDTDLKYLAIRFMTTETITYKSIQNEDVKDIQELIKDIIFYVNVTFKIDLSDDENLYKNLYTHLLALVIRIRFGIKTKNPLIEDIKKNMPLAFNIATYISKIIFRRYNKEISESEIAYIAVIIYMSKGLNSLSNNKKNILIVCPSGSGISKFLIYTYNNLFSDYSNLVSSCSVHELLDINFETVDVIFSLVDIDFKLPKPVYKIDYFLTDDDIAKIKRILGKEKSYLDEIFSEDLFTYIKQETSKEELIKLMSNKLLKINNMDKDIENLILEREKLGLTEISEKVAIPHPIKQIKNVNVVGVCILKKPILWQKNKVNIVLFMCVNNGHGENEIIYKRLTNIINNKEHIESILKNPTYAHFIDILNKLEEKENEL